jgi:flavodoxin
VKTAVVYYSYEGNCALVAETLKGILNADVLEIKTADTKKRGGLAKFFWGGGQVLMHRKPALLSYAFDAGAYDLIILGSPVWAGSPAPAMESFLGKTKIAGKKIALFVCHAGGKGKALEKFRALVPGNDIAGEIDFINPAEDGGEEMKKKIGAWAKSLGA